MFRVKSIVSESLYPSLPLSFSICLSFACSSDNFADRLSRFQQRDVVAFLSEETVVRGRMLTVLFKLLKGRTKVLTTPHKGGISSRFSRAALTARFSPSDNRARCWRGRKFFLRGARCRKRDFGEFQAEFRELFIGLVSQEGRTTIDAMVGARLCTSRINGLANRARKSKATLDMIRTAHRAGILLSYRKSRKETFNWTVFYIKGTKKDIAVSSWRHFEIFSYVSLEIIYNIKNI